MMPSPSHRSEFQGTDRNSFDQSRPVWLLLVIVATWVAYIPALCGGFVWDDYTYILHGDLTRAPDGLRRIWLTTESPDYFPIPYSLMWLEWRVWGDRAPPYHIIGLLFHTAVVLLLARCLRRLAVPGSILIAAMFALHPVNVETAAWVYQQRTTLPMIFSLLCVLAWLRFEDSSQRLWYAAALLAFVTAMLSKTSVVTLPLVLLGCAWWRRGRVSLIDVARSIPFFAVASFFGAVTIWFQYHRAIGVEIVRADSQASRLMIAGWAVWFYLYKTFIPIDLSFVYPRWTPPTGQPLNWLPLIALVAAFVGLWYARRGKGRAPLAALGYFVITLLPMLGFLNIYFMKYSFVADHWLYASIIGPIALIGGWIAMVAARGSTPARIAAGAISLALAVMTFQRARVFGDQITVWRDTIAKNPAAWIAYNNLGGIAMQIGRYDDARRLLTRSLELNPHNARALNNLAILQIASNDSAAAVATCDRALAVDGPRIADVHNTRGLALLTLGREFEAIDDLQKCLQIDANSVNAHMNLGKAYLRAGKFDDAERHLRIVFQLAPNQPEPHALLADSLLGRGRTDEAVEQYRAAAERSPRDPAARFKLAVALSRAKRLPTAIEEARQLVSLAPRSPDARNLLGSLLMEANRNDEAIRELIESVRLAPEAPEARFNLATALLRAGRNADVAEQCRAMLQRDPNDAEARRLLDQATASRAAPTSGRAPGGG